MIGVDISDEREEQIKRSLEERLKVKDLQRRQGGDQDADAGYIDTLDFFENSLACRDTAESKYFEAENDCSGIPYWRYLKLSSLFL